MDKQPQPRQYLINSEQLLEKFDESQRWLIDSGLYMAISCS